MSGLRPALRRALRRSPACNWALRWILPHYRRLAVARNTEIVIEGYPRCANTFAVVAFRMAQPREVPIAHHLHSVGQVLRGVRRGLPTLVLLRNPSDAILSLAVRKELQEVEPAVDEYLDFHRGVSNLGDKIVVAEFHEITTDMGAVTRRVNRRFGTSFGAFVHTKESEAAVFEEIDRIEKHDGRVPAVRATHVARPSAERKKHKQAYVEQLRAPAIQRKLAEAEELYQKLCQAYGVSTPGKPADDQ